MYGKVHIGINDENTRFHYFKCREDFLHTTNAQNLSYSLKVNEFAALTTRKSVSRYTGYKHNDVCPTMCGMV